MTVYGLYNVQEQVKETKKGRKLGKYLKNKILKITLAFLK